jgi:photosystem II stability/assembly factor-like uncharacterized protein
MNQILVCTLFFLTYNIIFSQSIWQQFNSPEGGFVKALVKLDNGDVLAGTESGIFRSSNSGNSWQASQVGLLPSSVRAIVISENSKVWAGTDRGVFLSNDNGFTWQQKFTEPTFSLASSQSGTIYAGLYHAIAKTEDDGENWTSVSYGLPWNNFTALGITSNGIIFAGNTQGNILYSTDGGADWSYSPSSSGINAIAINDLDEIFIGGAYAFQKSTNYGISWITIENGLQAYPNKEVETILCTEEGVWAGLNKEGIFFLPNNRNTWEPKNNGLSSSIKIRSLLKIGSTNIIAGSNLGIYLSQNSGNQWAISNSGLNCLNFLDIETTETTNIFGCFDGGIYVSLDEGETWQLKGEYLPKNNWEKLAVDSENRIYTATYWGDDNLVRSDDFGDTWVNLTDSTTNFQGIRDIVVSPISDDVFVCGHTGIFRSTDFGNSWETIFYDWANTINIHPNGDLYAGTYKVFRSTDNGGTWSSIYTGNNIGAIEFMQDSILVITSGLDILYSLDSGSTWEYSNQNIPEASSISDLIITNLGNPLVSMYNEGIFYNYDFDLPWIESQFGLDNQRINSLEKFGNKILAATKGSGLFYNFEDYLPVELSTFYIEIEGETVTLKWSTSSEINNLGFEIFCNDKLIGFKEGKGSSTQITNYIFVDKQFMNGEKKYDLYQVDYNGKREKIASRTLNLEHNTYKFNLSDNYPNPFNPTTTIKFTIPMHSFVTLKIFDLLGREISTLVNEDISPGIYEAAFDGSTFASGIYIYQIKAGEFSSSKKLILMK